ncbi:[FeFe] hydrogenase H-cluster maturation GTPase HydF [Candidatus Izimaplasma bacterium ZiA1]|uniref:[FeFe] hydrogenase H-cluster maturation GTPase HydF n=1 Tax=Candidatus Izimoplasma sp. ZiA1 TaxID=2024899 RepID=UPI000BAA8330|nr:[FeFe] hydrogenase H-cluster maturation GTPase HydF [Candidatus Izimaplasma bacterium ZiA1]
MNNTPRSIRSHIAIFGKRNVGKSSLINAITNQETALVSEHLGTTTDPVYKSMEILPLGPIVLIDTAGIDDVGDLGELRVKRTLEVINKIDLGIVVIDILNNNYDYELEIIETLKNKNKAYILVANKIDLVESVKDLSKVFNQEIYQVSSATKEGISNLKEVIGQSLNISKVDLPIISDLIKPNDVVILVTPIDSAAPKGRIILPQQQTLREILDTGGIAVVTKETELEETLKRVKPDLVVTDSQAFEIVSEITPNIYPLTSFSILFARNKGNLVQLVKGAKALDSLKEGSTILISEGCTHHRQCDDIGTVKIPKWLKEYTKKDFNLIFSSGHSFIDKVDQADLVIHCGACMLNKNEMQFRLQTVNEKEIPIINYGVFIAYTHGVFDRALDIFPEVKELWTK